MLMIMMSGKNLYKQISTNDHLCLFFWFDGQSIQWVLFKPLYNGNSRNSHQSTSPTAKLK